MLAGCGIIRNIHPIPWDIPSFHLLEELSLFHFPAFIFHLQACGERDMEQAERRPPALPNSAIPASGGNFPGIFQPFEQEEKAGKARAREKLLPLSGSLVPGAAPGWLFSISCCFLTAIPGKKKLFLDVFPAGQGRCGPSRVAPSLSPSVALPWQLGVARAHSQQGIGFTSQWIPSTPSQSLLDFWLCFMG